MSDEAEIALDDLRVRLLEATVTGALRVLRRPPPPTWESECLGRLPECWIESLPICWLAVPSGAEGPVRPDLVWYRDPYFVAWLGEVAWDPVERVLYARPLPTAAIARRIVRAFPDRE